MARLSRFIPDRLPAYADEAVTLYLGDARQVLSELPEHCADCCVCSPPYWNLRSYGTAPKVWGGDPACDHCWAISHRSQGASCQGCDAWLGELGQEPTPQLFVHHLVEVFREVRRVLKPWATLWLVLGDTHCRTSLPGGLKPKDLAGIPWRVALALQEDGWYLRSEIILHKPSAVPESIRDRPTRAHDTVFLLAPSRRYHYDAEAIREPASTPPGPNSALPSGREKYDNPNDGLIKVHSATRLGSRYVGNGWRNRRSVWTIGSQPYAGAHFAAFPPRLVEPCVLAGTSAAGVCSACGRPWVRTAADGDWGASCACNAPVSPSVVLDPFCGSGTTLAVAKSLGRAGLGTEVQPAYMSLVRDRCQRITSGQPIVREAA
jgi:DNA modification methylase